MIHGCLSASLAVSLLVTSLSRILQEEVARNPGYGLLRTVRVVLGEETRRRGEQQSQSSGTAEKSKRKDKIDGRALGGLLPTYFEMKSFAVGETRGHGWLLRSTSKLRTLLKISWSVSPQNGGAPESRI